MLGSGTASRVARHIKGKPLVRGAKVASNFARKGAVGGPGFQRVSRAVMNHPYRTMAGASVAIPMYQGLPGPQRSRQNQDDATLRRIRAHQASSGLTGVMPKSIGGYA